ncbi:MAG: SPASM domain-containing protein [Ruminococcus flavefaciens]|nr:SPASM domain-containing protein [Ruminococcus flavefaciens]
MLKKEEKRMDNKIPQKLYSLEITTNIGCKINCKHCPQSTLIHTYRESRNNVNSNMMSLEMFKTCIAKVIPGGTISFCGMSEPFLNHECAKMIRYAYEQGYRIMLFTTLVGMSMSDLELIQDIQFHSVCLHIPDQLCNAHIDISDEYIQVLKEFTKKIKINSYSCHGEVHDLVKEYILQDVYLRTKLHGRAGNIEDDGIEKYEHKGKIICTCGELHGGFTPILLPDGTVLICGNDYGMKHVLGNLYKQEWKDIAQGEELKKVLYGFQDDRVDTLCRHCHNARSADETQSREFIAGPINALCVANLMNDGKDAVESPSKQEIMEKLKYAKNICVFGYGKLFHDNYYLSAWNDVIGANYITDNDFSKIEPDTVPGMKVIEPDKLKSIDDLLIVTYVKEDREIRTQLTEMGLTNCINIYDIYKLSQG